MATPESHESLTSVASRTEWLALESSWGTAKSPFRQQWNRWLTQDTIRDPDSTIGIVVGGNLQRFHTYIRNAKTFSENSLPNNQMLALAAEHLGKMAGGLISITAHSRTNPSKWDLPFKEHIDTLAASTTDVVQLANSGRHTSLALTEYYELVTSVLQEIQHNPVEQVFALQADILTHVAGLAVKTWFDFLDSNDNLKIVSGATPRSSGAYIEELRADFEQYIPSIKAAVN